MVFEYPMKQLYSRLNLGFGIVTGIQALTSKWSPGLAVDFEGLKTGTF